MIFVPFVVSALVLVKEEVNKQSLLGDREQVGPDKLRLFGMRVTQSEDFYVEPKLTETEPRITEEGPRHD